MSIFTRIIVTIWMVTFFLSVQAASNQYMAGKPEVKVTVRVPLRSNGESAYCAAWAEKVIYGIAAHMRASEAERNRELIITYQTSEEDLAKPDIFWHVDTDDGLHSTVVMVTDGNDERGHWFVDEEVKRWSETVYFYGWDWAARHPESEWQDSRRGRGWWTARMHGECIRDPKL